LAIHPMLDTNYTANLSKKQKQNALLRVLKATSQLSAEFIFYGSSLAAIALVAGSDLPSTLSTIAATIGGNALSAILQKVATNQAVPEKDIVDAVEKAIAETQIQEALKNIEVQQDLANLTRRLNLVEYAYRNGEYHIVQLLLEQYSRYEGMLSQLSGQFSLVLSQLDSLTINDHTILQNVEYIRKILESSSITTSIDNNQKEQTSSQLNETRHVDVFISYARADGSNFAQRLHDDLEKKGFQAWLDIHDIANGADWDEEIDTALQIARVVVVLLTPAAILSIQVKSEWLSALSHYTPVIPLIMKTCDVPRILRVLNYIDFRADYETNFALLCQRLKNIDTDHINYLNRLLEAFKVAQSDAEDKKRFDEKIKDLQLAIATYSERQGKGVSPSSPTKPVFSPDRNRPPTVRTVGERLRGTVDYFRDREYEKKKISSLLALPSTRVISVIGQGGIGKTALANRILHELERLEWSHLENNTDYPPSPVSGMVYLSTRTGGITLERIFIHCAELFGGDKEAELYKVWTKVNVSVAGKVTAILNAFGQDIYVILLDNFEDKLDDEGTIIDSDLNIFIEQCLSTTANVRLLVTTRTALTLNKEFLRQDMRVYLDAGLPIKESNLMLQDLDPDGSYGVRALSDDKLTAISERLHGVPRALEVFVSILANNPFISFDDVLKEFYEQTKVVHELVEESYRRLDLKSRYVIEALAVLGRPVTTDAVDYLLMPFGFDLDTASILSRLWRTHVVNLDINRTNGLVSLHPINRDYSYNLLPKDGSYSRKSLELRAAAYYSQLGDTSKPWKSFKDLEPKISQFEHLIRAEEYDQAGRMLDEIDYSYLSQWGYTLRVKDMREELHGKIIDPELDGENRVNLGRVHRSLGHYEQAIEYSRQGLSIAPKMRGWIKHYALRNMGYANHNLGNYDAAAIPLLESLQLALDTQDIIAQYRALGALGVIYIDAGQFQDAIKYLESGRTIAKNVIAENSDAWIESIYQTYALGRAYSDLGELQEGIKDLESALANARAENHRRLEGDCLSSLCKVYREYGDYESAIRYGSKGADLSHEIGADRIEGSNLGNLGIAYLALGNIDIAYEKLVEALKIAERTHSLTDQQLWRIALAEVYLRRQDLNTAYSTVLPATLYDTQKYHHMATNLCGIVLGRLDRRVEAQSFFQMAQKQSSESLVKASKYYEANYSKSAALLGQSLLSDNHDNQNKYLHEAQLSYEIAMSNCGDKGVVEHAISLVDMLRPLDSDNLLQTIMPILKLI
jgi:tetratricopeptide (TPR) repeat protein